MTPEMKAPAIRIPSDNLPKLAQEVQNFIDEYSKLDTDDANEQRQAVANIVNALNELQEATTVNVKYYYHKLGRIEG